MNVLLITILAFGASFMQLSAAEIDFDAPRTFRVIEAYRVGPGISKIEVGAYLVSEAGSTEEGTTSLRKLLTFDDQGKPNGIVGVSLYLYNPQSKKRVTLTPYNPLNLVKENAWSLVFESDPIGPITPDQTIIQMRLINGNDETIRILFEEGTQEELSRSITLDCAKKLASN